jgi:hypothetical protein
MNVFIVWSLIRKPDRAARDPFNNIRYSCYDHRSREMFHQFGGRNSFLLDLMTFSRNDSRPPRVRSGLTASMRL